MSVRMVEKISYQRLAQLQATSHNSLPPPPPLPPLRHRRHKRCPYPPARRPATTTSTSMPRVTCPCLTSRHWPGTSRTGRRGDDGREFFGKRVLVVEKVWELLERDSLLPEGGRPKHLLWALHFMKVYPKQSPGCLAVSASGRRPEDPPQVGLGVYRRRRQPGRSGGE
jgi:hypothetical protein